LDKHTHPIFPEAGQGRVRMWQTKKHMQPIGNKQAKENFKLHRHIHSSFKFFLEKVGTIQG